MAAASVGLIVSLEQEHVIMYERFTDDARKVLQIAREAALQLNHEHLATEHVLFGLIRQGNGMAIDVLQNLGVDTRTLRHEVEELVRSGPVGVSSGKLPQTPETKSVIKYAMEESRNLRHSYVGTEHLLLGLLRQQEVVAARVLNALGVTIEDARAEVSELSEEDEGTPESGGLLIGPKDVEREIRYAVRSCWVGLSEEKRNVDELERRIRQIVDRALQDFRVDFDELSGTKKSD